MALVRPTHVWITVRLALCDRSRFHFYRRFTNISWAHVPGPARNGVKRFYRSAGPRVGVDNEYQDGLQQIFQWHKPDALIAVAYAQRYLDIQVATRCRQPSGLHASRTFHLRLYAQ
ncbi:hypothetical protein EDD22DRAFT_972425 [Suillus occidentalis]|nr:hypothetical protein EDD22DRAFT_972425 [Suillus occidentalis]